MKKPSCIIALFLMVSPLLSLARAQQPDMGQILQNLPPEVLQQLTQQAKPAGPKTYRPISAGGALNGVSATAKTSVVPVNESMQGGSVLAFQVVGNPCPEKTKFQGKYRYNVFVLFVDEEHADNQFVANQTAQRARQTIKGRMDRWEPAADYCDSGDFNKVDSGAGGLYLEMTTAMHMTPRNFMASTVSGRVWGPGLTDTLQRNPYTGPAPAVSSFAVGEQNLPSSQVLDALRQRGVNIPDISQTQIPDKITRNGVTIQVKQPLLTGALVGSKMIPAGRGVSIPALQVMFSTSSVEDTVGLTIYSPAVLGGMAVGESEEETKGAQTFVNLDNDDQDEDFDNATRDREIAGEDEMVKVKLKLFPWKNKAGNYGTAKLQVIGDAASIRIWKSASKGGLVDMRQPFKVPDDFEPDGQFVKKEVWLEGVKAHTGQRAVTLRLTYTEVPKDEDNVSLTVVGIESIKWEGDKNSENDDNTLLTDPNHIVPGGGALPVAGLRVFPGKRLTAQGLSDVRNVVKVKVKLSAAPVEPLPIYFKAFDVDDPTDDARDSKVDDESSSTDNRGEGRFETEDALGIHKAEFTKAEQDLKFTVSMQPGDNYRIVANGDRDFVAYLHNNDTKLGSTVNRQRIVNSAIWDKGASPVAAELREADKYASDVLTVWRKLYVELDRMAPVENNYVKAGIQLVNHYPNTGRSVVTLDTKIRSQMASGWGLVNCFENGELDIPHHGKFEIVSNTGYGMLALMNDRVTVKGQVPAAAKGNLCFLRDDDYTVHKFDEQTAIPALFLGQGVSDRFSIESRYARAYVLPDFTTLEATNTDKVVPFKANTPGDTAADLTPNYLFNHEGYENDPEFWTVYLLAAFQGNNWEDGDPDNEEKLGGIVDNLNGQGAHIFLENLNDQTGRFNNGVRQQLRADGWGEVGVITHEIGHLFGAEHGDGDLMDAKNWIFSHVSLDKIRSTQHP